MQNEREILSALLSDGKYRDLVLDCQGNKLNVHRNVVCVQSTFFDAACSSGFKETKNHTIILPKDDPESIKRLVNYFYTGDYTVDEGDESVNELLLHVRMYDLAVKYGVRKLDTLVMKKFPTALKTALTKSPSEFIVQAVREMYTKIPEREGKMIKDALLATPTGQELVDKISATVEFRELCEEHGEIGHGFFRARMEYDSQRLKLMQDRLAAVEAACSTKTAHISRLEADIKKKAEELEKQKKEHGAKIKELTKTLEDWQNKAVKTENELKAPKKR